MSTPLNHYLKDGANHQARAVLAYLQAREGIEQSWNKERHCYDAEINVARWENCREQGYVVSLRAKGNQINIAFFEHRNSDSIAAIEWKQESINSLNINNAQFGEIYKTKHDVSHSVSHGNAVAMAEWIWDRLEFHWSKNTTRP